MSDVLIVEDETDVAEMLSLLLEHRGYRVRVARDGAQALTILREELPDVMVVDVEMPRLSGPEMVRAARAADPAVERVPVVLVSGVMGLPSIAQQLGTPHFLVKPFDVGALFRVLGAALERTGVVA